MALPVAIQVYSVRDEAKADLRGTLEQIKEMGYAGVVNLNRLLQNKLTFLILIWQALPALYFLSMPR